MKVSELTGVQLDYWVAKAEGYGAMPYKSGYWLRHNDEVIGFIGEKNTTTIWNYSPSTDWSQGGPIIQREGIWIKPWVEVNGVYDEWSAQKGYFTKTFSGTGPLEAAMRYFVFSKFGEELPDE